MNFERYLPSEKDTWHWRLAEPRDVIAITLMADQIYSDEIADIFTKQPQRMAHHVHMAITDQTYDLGRQQLIVAIDKKTNALLAYAWLERGGYTPYALEEMATAEFAHIDLSLPTTSRVRIMAQILQQWILWCQVYSIPVLVSTTIRADQSGFIRLHEAMGFKIRGSFAYKRIGEINA